MCIAFNLRNGGVCGRLLLALKIEDSRAPRRYSSNRSRGLYNCNGPLCCRLRLGGHSSWRRGGAGGRRRSAHRSDDRSRQAPNEDTAIAGRSHQPAEVTHKRQPSYSLGVTANWPGGGCACCEVDESDGAVRGGDGSIGARWIQSDADERRVCWVPAPQPKGSDQIRLCRCKK